eukprot:436503-Pelagomonas_calceolata.AAC.1
MMARSRCMIQAGKGLHDRASSFRAGLYACLRLWKRGSGNAQLWTCQVTFVPEACQDLPNHCACRVPPDFMDLRCSIF